MGSTTSAHPGAHPGAEITETIVLDSPPSLPTAKASTDKEIFVDSPPYVRHDGTPYSTHREMMMDVRRYRRRR